LALRLRTPIPSLEQADAWLNSGALTREELAGTPLLVHFWALGCELCKEQLPTVLRWRRELEPRGLRVVGVHTRVQATPHEADEAAIERAAREFGLTHPLAVDMTGALSREFHVTATPAYFVFDSAGLLRHFHVGYSAEPPVEAALERVQREYEQAHPEAMTREARD
jgi:thiol-disulfide isomerase/thioredoxin